MWQPAYITVGENINIRLLVFCLFIKYMNIELDAMLFFLNKPPLAHAQWPPCCIFLRMRSGRHVVFSYACAVAAMPAGRVRRLEG
jgi:hypothetical protein